MSFNEPGFITEFTEIVKNLNIKTALEIGYGSGELVEALRSLNIEAEGIDQSDELSSGKVAPYLHKVALEDFIPKKKYDLVYSSGVLEHFNTEDIPNIINIMAAMSKKYIVNFVPNANCKAYRSEKAITPAPWKDELNITLESLVAMHELAGLKVISTGYAAAEWAKRFGHEPSEPYLIFCICKK